MNALNTLKDAGPIAIGLGGLLFGYVNSRGPAREARHHARVEALYHDMLVHLTAQSRRTMEYAQLEYFGERSDEEPEQRVTDARIQLFASTPVQEDWDAATALLVLIRNMRTDEPGDQDLAAQHINTYLGYEDRLIRAMRDDLGVPEPRRIGLTMKGYARKLRYELRLWARRRRRKRLSTGRS